jgi:hypothetical protein
MIDRTLSKLQNIARQNQVTNVTHIKSHNTVRNKQLELLNIHIPIQTNKCTNSVQYTRLKMSLVHCTDLSVVRYTKIGPDDSSVVRYTKIGPVHWTDFSVVQYTKIGLVLDRS